MGTVCRTARRPCYSRIKISTLDTGIFDYISISELRNFLPKCEKFLLKHLVIAQNCRAKCCYLYICNIIHKIYVIGNIPLSVSHIGVSHMKYELFNNCDHGSVAKVWSYFWEIIEASELGTEVFSNNNSSNKYIISLWIAAFNWC